MILIHPFGTKQKNGSINAKTYPYWGPLIKLLGNHVVQVGVKGDSRLCSDFKQNLPIKELTEIVKQCDYWVAIDSFLPHLAHLVGKPGVVLWGPSDPSIYGYEENLNLVKDKSYFRKDQFGIWEGYQHVPAAFVDAAQAFQQIQEWRSKLA